MNFVTLAAAVAVVAAMLAPATASADTTGTAGPVIGLELNEDSSDEYLAYRGRIFVSEGGGTVQVYRWGGTACNGITMSDPQVDILGEAINNKAARVIPYWKLGAGGARCLVSFGVTNASKNLPLITR